ncbi:MAG: polyphosphate kinase 1 [Bacteroidetes bacterium]|nr:MAG: polyphosphate kinase 1 [Bacteroidota bacterium]
MKNPAHLPAQMNRYVNRDLSWLGFNHRVLEEALDPNLAVYDKIKFLAIHASNLDEFYRVRISDMETQDKLGAVNHEEASSYTQILSQLRAAAQQQVDEVRRILAHHVVPELKQNNIVLYLNDADVRQEHEGFIKDYFLTKVLSFLQPVQLKPGLPPFLEDRALYFIGNYSIEGGGQETMLLNIPSQYLPRFLTLPPLDGCHYIVYLDDVVRLGIKTVLHTHHFSSFYSIKLNRDAGLNLDEDAGEIAEQMKISLQQRAFGLPSRFQHDPDMPATLVSFCHTYFRLEQDEIAATSRYQHMTDLFGFPNPLKPQLEQPHWPSYKLSALASFPNYFDAIDQADVMLHFPYQSYDHVLIFFNQAVLDPYVTEVMATFYRVAADSHIVNALISAAKNGKKVKAFVEVKARFDEANNLRWAERMIEAGVEITYSLPDIKVHAKTALIVRQKEGVTKLYAFYGTGNFNEKTAGVYSDIGLLTANAAMNAELKSVFHFLYNQQRPAKFSHLLVSQFNIIDGFKQLIAQEIEAVKQGREGRITIKLNNLEDTEMIDALYEASSAGVKINLIVRSICRLRPGLEGISQNISLVRVVGRYLEHSRVFVFHQDGQQKIYLGSADWMRRNLRSRIEVVFPVYDERCRKQVLHFVNTQLQPYAKTRLLNANLQPVPFGGLQPVGYDAQEAFQNYIASLQSPTD